MKDKYPRIVNSIALICVAMALDSIQLCSTKY